MWCVWHRQKTWRFKTSKLDPIWSLDTHRSKRRKTNKTNINLYWTALNQNDNTFLFIYDCFRQVQRLNAHFIASVIECLLYWLSVTCSRHDIAEEKSNFAHSLTKRHSIANNYFALREMKIVLITSTKHNIHCELYQN
jgi:hypothetical protein